MHELNDRSMGFSQSEKQRECNLNNKNKISITSVTCRPITKELCFVFFKEMATQVWPQKETQERHRKTKFIIHKILEKQSLRFLRRPDGR